MDLQAGAPDLRYRKMSLEIDRNSAGSLRDAVADEISGCDPYRMPAGSRRRWTVVDSVIERPVDLFIGQVKELKAIPLTLRTVFLTCRNTLNRTRLRCPVLSRPSFVIVETLSSNLNSSYQVDKHRVPGSAIKIVRYDYVGESGQPRVVRLDIPKQDLVGYPIPFIPRVAQVPLYPTRLELPTTTQVRAVALEGALGR